MLRITQFLHVHFTLVGRREQRSAFISMLIFNRFLCCFTILLESLGSFIFTIITSCVCVLLTSNWLNSSLANSVGDEQILLFIRIMWTHSNTRTLLKTPGLVEARRGWRASVAKMMRLASKRYANGAVCVG